MNILTGRLQKIDRREALRYLGYTPSTGDISGVIPLLDELEERVLAVQDLKAVYGIFDIKRGDMLDLGFAKIDSRDLGRYLSDCNRLALFFLRQFAEISESSFRILPEQFRPFLFLILRQLREILKGAVHGSCEGFDHDSVTPVSRKPADFFEAPAQRIQAVQSGFLRIECFPEIMPDLLFRRQGRLRGGAKAEIRGDCEKNCR